MAKTHDIGQFYWHTLKYPIKFKGFFDKAESQEIEEPYRAGSGLAIRFPFTKFAIVLGKWGKKYEESYALTRALAGRMMSQEEVNWDKIRGIDVEEEI